MTNVPSAPSLALKQEKIRGRLVHVEWSTPRSLPTKSINFDGLVLYFWSSAPPAWYRTTACAWWGKHRTHPGSSSIWNLGHLILFNTGAREHAQNPKHENYPGTQHKAAYVHHLSQLWRSHLELWKIRFILFMALSLLPRVEVDQHIHLNYNILS